VIRQANLSDLPVILEMGAAFFQEAHWSKFATWQETECAFILSKIIETPEDNILLVYDDGIEILGMIGIVKQPLWFNCEFTIGQELFWYTRPKKRSSGIGVKLLLAAEKRAKEIGYNLIVMASVEKMPDLKALYEKTGFVLTENTFMKRV
jgi:GNAT superfamily N-acetyltransferase